MKSQFSNRLHVYMVICVKVSYMFIKVGLGIAKCDTFLRLNTWTDRRKMFRSN